MKKGLKSALAIALVCLIAGIPVQTFARHAKTSWKESDHTYIIRSAKEFSTGALQNVTIHQRPGDGALTLKKRTGAMRATVFLYPRKFQPIHSSI
ncbi:hypothetical protein NBRC111894_2176 [Sporolactobacillus inulinus]|uniref:Uncharacterized protein n=1 Tax=Sporolactobacillus inulinus TaxID=2078 RepID=A0A4Y1ZBZ7_9BACL|nr:hypothetical protein [Sporolactobacillus inulinus]GAY76622.1 hypothetical protein NBRC111894_2176 [Sporolactobacillus inulinus]